jgi:hypothetical protein
MPGDAGYGSALLGYHYYTWTLLGFIAAVVLLAAILLFDRQFEEDNAVLTVHRRRLRANRGVARDRAHGGERGDDAAGMRLRRLR